MQCYAMCKIEFHDYEFQKMKRSNGIEFLKFSIEKVWKMIFKNAWEPVSVTFSESTFWCVF